jgi:hypothetical protein
MTKNQILPHELEDIANETMEFLGLGIPESWSFRLGSHEGEWVYDPWYPKNGIIIKWTAHYLYHTLTGYVNLNPRDDIGMDTIIRELRRSIAWSHLERIKG